MLWPAVQKQITGTPPRTPRGHPGDRDGGRKDGRIEKKRANIASSQDFMFGDFEVRTRLALH